MTSTITLEAAPELTSNFTSEDMLQNPAPRPHPHAPKVLVAVDEPEQFQAICCSLKSRVWPSDSQFLLLYVNDTFEPWHISDKQKRAWWADQDLVNAEMASVLEAYKTELKSAFPQCSIQTLIEQGSVVNQINHIATLKGADVLFLGSRNLSDVALSYLSSVCESIIQEIPCTVEIVKPGHTSSTTSVPSQECNQRTVIGLSGSTTGINSLGWLSEQEWFSPSEIQIVSCPPITRCKGLAGTHLKPSTLIDSTTITHAEWATKAAASLVLSIFPSSIVTTTIKPENAGESILQIAKDWQADTILLPMQNWSASDNKATSTFLVRFASCDLIAIP